ncbi:MAG: TonB C-terminal domain-containing protein [Burkholderiales bacterium]
MAITTAHIQTTFDRYRIRISIGVLLSLLVHGFILSLRLGIPGLGLPGLELPWTEQRAQIPQLNIRIANVTKLTTIAPQYQPLLQENDAVLNQQNVLQQLGSNQPLTELLNARVKQTPLLSASNSLRVTRALKSIPAIAQELRKNGVPPPAEQSSPATARSQPKLIALTDDRAGSFKVPKPDSDERWRVAVNMANTPSPIHLPDETAPAIAIQSPVQPVEQAMEPSPAAQKPARQRSFERPDDLQAKQPTPIKTPDVAMELALKKQGEEIEQQAVARKQEEQQAAQLARDIETKKQEELEKARKLETIETARLAAQKLEAEQTALRAEELAIKKRDDAKKQHLADAELKAKELEARRQAEEITRQQASALALQKQLEAAQKQADEIARRKIDADAGPHRAGDRISAASTASNRGADASNSLGDAKIQSGQLGAGNLASKALEQIEKTDLIRAYPPPASESEDRKDTRRRSIFGSIDHDIALAMYIEGWRTKIERNDSLNYAQSSKDKARNDPVVTVAIRSDGSVEDIIINRSSGRADLDAAVRRIVALRAPYSVFPANLARKYDVIEIRRIWNFDDRLKILEELR